MKNIRKLPSYPLFLKDPHFQVWMPGENISNIDSTFVNNRITPLLGLIKTKDKIYRFLGTKFGIKMNVEKIDVTALKTIFILKNELFEITLEFISPLILTDLELLANPTCILSYDIKTEVKDYDVIFGVSSKILSNSTNDDYLVRGDIATLKNKKVAYFSKYKQEIMSMATDNHGPEYGVYYLLSDKAKYVLKTDLLKSLDDDNIIASIKDGEHYILGINKHSLNDSGKFYFAYDDIVSIYYYGEMLKGYYFNDGKNIYDALNETIINSDKIIEKCNKFDLDFDKRMYITNEYLEIARASYRQSVAGHKLVKDRKNRILFISKEISSGGCTSTVDVTYPTFPLYLLYNPTLVKGMLYPIFDFAKMPVWKYDFAPHDTGVYPYVIGQYYSSLWKDEDDLKRTLGYYDSKADGILPFYYLYEDGDKVYSMKRQMPIEECADMIILTYLVSKYSNDYSMAIENYDNLKKWANYLVNKGLIPENQLCTDDFSGHQDKNINLSIKSIVALKYFDKLLKAINKIENIDYLKIAKERMEMIDKYTGHIPMTFDSDYSTFSLKYNLVPDLLDDDVLFRRSIMEKEVDLYLNKKLKYGIPLDNRETYTKVDWLIWISTLTNDIKKQNEIYKLVIKFLKETITRVPFSDWYKADTSEACLFRTRPVVGGNFMPILLKEFMKK